MNCLASRPNQTRCSLFLLALAVSSSWLTFSCSDDVSGDDGGLPKTRVVMQQGTWAWTEGDDSITFLVQGARIYLKQVVKLCKDPTGNIGIRAQFDTEVSSAITDNRFVLDNGGTVKPIHIEGEFTKVDSAKGAYTIGAGNCSNTGSFTAAPTTTP